ncbi:DUF5718 family protein [Hydrogenovibrio halophilus]|uniref:DUF5718 family protein n=1 Tax=Hydrogenovibrio halophilus TaxID=373391 RepID=UPI00037639BE|nr:DUF5718 family protein [Hydrogenovibrio halophilus]
MTEHNATQQRNTLSHTQLFELPVFGIAGNFADHLSQAKESGFDQIVTADPKAPKGVFPIYLPGDDSYLGVYPLSHDVIEADFDGDDCGLQLEAEICVLCDLSYDAQGLVRDCTPTAFSVFNDCTQRCHPAQKLSAKKNWGHASTGIARQWQPIDAFAAQGVLDHYHLASFLKRGDEIVPYGVDCPVNSYQYFYQKVCDWLVHQFNTQPEQGPLEKLPGLLQAQGCPQQIIVSLGATRYTPQGEQTYLQPGDQIAIFAYSPQKLSHEDLVELVRREEDECDDAVILTQDICQSATERTL